MKSIRNRPLLMFLFLWILCTVVMPVTSHADLPYDTTTRDSFGDVIYTQAAYIPVKVLGQNLLEPDPKNPGKKIFSPLKGPKDLFVSENNEIFVADSGNNRIVQLNEAGELIRTIMLPESPFKNPQGVFVDKVGDIYVADTGNQRIVRLDKSGKLKMQYDRPKSAYIPDTYKFDPIRLVVDKRGFLYVATMGGYQGLLQLDPDGNFQGFFGVNSTIYSFGDRLKRFFYTKEMFAKELSKLPGSVNSVTADKDGFLYTVTGGAEIEKNQVKKLNFAGQDMLSKADAYGVSTTRTFGEVRREKTITQKPQLTDITVDRLGNITVIDSQFKYISQYDAAGNLLFFWSGQGSPSSVQIGLVKSPAAIEANANNELLILDDQQGMIQVFRPSEFGSLVHRANLLTLDGKYEESESLWRQVLRFNAKFAPAELGIAKALYKKGEYEEAMQLFREAGNQKGYSDAFWQKRLSWFQKNFPMIANIMLITLIGTAIAERTTRNTALRGKWRRRQRSQIPLVVQLKHVFTILKHPIDGFSAIRYEWKGSYLSAFVLLASGYISLCLMRTFTSFTFNRAEILPVNYGQILMQFVTIWIMWVVANYMIGSILHGEARFKDVFVGSSYCLTPLILIGIPLALISNGMTSSEAAIYDFLYNGMLIWMGLLFFWKVQSMQNYSVGETIVNILTTLFTMTIFGVLAAISFGLTNDLIQFIYSMYLEVKLR